MHAAAAEARDFARRIEARQRLAAGLQHARRQIRFKPAQRLAGEHVQLHGDQRPRIGIENLVRLRDADQLVAEILPRRADRHHLRVLAELVVDLAIARHDLALQFCGIDQIVACKLVHASDKLRQRLGGSRNPRRVP